MRSKTRWTEDTTSTAGLTTVKSSSTTRLLGTNVPSKKISLSQYMGLAVPGLSAAKRYLRNRFKSFLAGMRIRIRSDPVIFGPPDPDPVLFSTDPDPTCNNGFIKLFLS